MQKPTVTPFERVEQQNHSAVPRDGVPLTRIGMGHSVNAPVTPLLFLQFTCVAALATLELLLLLFSKKSRKTE